LPGGRHALYGNAGELRAGVYTRLPRAAGPHNIVISKQHQPAALLISAHPPGSGSGSAVRGSITMKALSAYGGVDAIALATPDERPFAAPGVKLVSRPPPRATRAQYLRMILTSGTAYWPERQAGLLQEISRRVGNGELASEYDVIWTHTTLMARAARACFRAHAHILDVDHLGGIDARRAAATSGGARPRRLAHQLDARAISREERRRISAFSDIVVCSDRERRLMGSVPGRVHVVPNTVPGPDRPYDLADDPTLLFVGFLGYEVNIDALQLLVSQIVPRIREQRPDARLVVAGRAPTDEVRALVRGPGIELVADAPTLDPLYRAARAVVAPLRQGGGTRIKVLEAMARGKPLVLTPIAAEGLDVTDGVEAFIEQDPARFAARCLQLLDDGPLATEMGLRGRAMWHERHRPEAAMERIAHIVTDALTAGAPSDPGRERTERLSPASQGSTESQP
jgi:glycosyltransferase involved in cell wall biosynthesis